MDMTQKKRVESVRKIDNAGLQIYKVMRYFECHDSAMREYVERLQSLLSDLIKIQVSMEHKINHLSD